MSPTIRVSIFLVFEIRELAVNGPPDLHIQAHWSTCGKGKRPGWVFQNGSFSSLALWSPRQSCWCLSLGLWMQCPSSLLMEPSIVTAQGDSQQEGTSLHLLQGMQVVEESVSLINWPSQECGEAFLMCYSHSSCVHALPSPTWVYFRCQARKENPSRYWNGEVALCIFTCAWFVNKWSTNLVLSQQAVG